MLILGAEFRAAVCNNNSASTPSFVDWAPVGWPKCFSAGSSGIGGFEKQVVLKKIRADIATDPEFITMFFDEARLAANLNHPNIVQMFEVDQLDGTPTSRWSTCTGATLRTSCSRPRSRKLEIPLDISTLRRQPGVRRPRPRAQRRRRRGRPMLSIVHRDISPQNIIVSLEGDVEALRLRRRQGARQPRADRHGSASRASSPIWRRSSSAREAVDAKADVYARRRLHVRSDYRPAPV